VPIIATPFLFQSFYQAEVDPARPHCLPSKIMDCCSLALFCDRIAAIVPAISPSVDLKARRGGGALIAYWAATQFRGCRVLSGLRGTAWMILSHTELCRRVEGDGNISTDITLLHTGSSADFPLSLCLQAARVTRTPPCFLTHIPTIGLSTN
jgi:hypothetical protein